MKKVATIGIIVCLINAGVSKAQIIPDQTLPSNSVVIPNTENVTIINGGTTKGNNLFHSFEEFSVINNHEAYFNNFNNIENIFSRVTGSNISTIDGLIKTANDANFFLINPNGIIFTENASLDVGGSFTATTGGILFGDGNVFNAVNPNDAILTVSIPVGVQLGSSTQEIQITGNGNNIYSDPDFYHINTSTRPAGLATAEKEDLILAASSIQFDGGNISAPGGNIQLIASNQGTYNFETLTLNQVANGNINLVNAASTSTNGDLSGTTTIEAKNLSLFDGSAILNNVEGLNDGGDINIKVENLSLVGNSPTHNSVIANDVSGLAEGNSGNINILAKNIDILDGGFISAVSYDVGNSGNINIESSQIKLSGIGLFPSTISAQSNYLGTSGDINILADNIILENSAEISSINFFESFSGNVNIQSQNLNISNEARILTATVGNDSGNISINADNVNLSEGGQIASLNFGYGQSGSIDINAKELSADGYLSVVSGIYNTALAEGNSGDINVNSEEILLSNGAVIEGSSAGSGNPANIHIKTNVFEASGFGYDEQLGDDVGSGVRSGKGFDALGDGGNILIEADLVNLSEAAQISTNTDSTGKAGNIEIQANQLSLDGFVEQGRTAIISSATSSTGNGGTIKIETQETNITNGASITASNFPTRRTDIEPGQGNPGSISINSQVLNLKSTTEPSSITTATVSGKNGRINLNSDSINLENGTITTSTLGKGSGGVISLKGNEVNLEQKSLIASESEGSGDAGTIKVETPTLTINNSTISSTSTNLGEAGNLSFKITDLNAYKGKIIAESTLSGGGDIFLTSNNLQLDKNSLISTSVKDSTGGGGNISIDNSNLILLENNSDIRANAVFGNGGNINIETLFLFSSLNSDIDASSQFGIDGTTEINKNLENPLTSEKLPESYKPSQVINSLCPIAKENSFAVTGTGGIATTPLDKTIYGQRVNTTWQEDELYSTTSSSNPRDVASSINSNSTLLEAGEIVVQEDGSISLVPTKSISLNNSTTHCR